MTARPPVAVLALALVVAILGARFAVDILQLARKSDARDFATIYTGAVVWREGGRFYDSQPGRGQFGALTENPDVLAAARRLGTLHAHEDYEHIHVFSYPPFTVLAFLPFTTLGFRPAAVLYLALGLGFLALAGWCLWRAARLSAVAGLTLAAVALVFEPLENSLGLGQINQLILVLLCVFLWALAAGRDTTAGIALGLATALRLHPALFVVYLAWRGRWRACAWAAATAGGGTAVAAAVVGWETTVEYAAVVAPKYATAFPGLGNLSLTGWLTIVGPALVPAAPLAVWRGAGTLLSVGVVVAVLTWIRPGGGAGSRRTVHEVALLAAVQTLVTPNTTINHLVFLFLPLAVLLEDALAEGSATRVAWLAVAVALVGGIDDYYMHPRLAAGPAALLGGIKTYGVVIVVALAALVARRRPAEAPGRARVAEAPA